MRMWRGHTELCKTNSIISNIWRKNSQEMLERMERTRSYDLILLSINYMTLREFDSLLITSNMDLYFDYYEILFFLILV